MALGGEAVGIDEVGVLKPQLLGALVHFFHALGHTARYQGADGVGRIVAGLDHQPIEQVLKGHLLPGIDRNPGRVAGGRARRIGYCHQMCIRDSINYAVCEWKRGRLDRAIELMEQAAQDGVNSMIYGSLGYMLIEKARQTGDFSKAEAFNAQAYEYDDEDPVTLDLSLIHI